MSADLANGLWEAAGSLVGLLASLQVLRDRRVEGTRWWLPLFFWSWCAWNLWYYPAIDQWWSFLGACLMFLSNGTYACLLWWFRRHPRRSGFHGPPPPRHVNCRCVAIPLQKWEAALDPRTRHQRPAPQEGAQEDSYVTREEADAYYIGATRTCGDLADRFPCKRCGARVPAECPDYETNRA